MMKFPRNSRPIVSETVHGASVTDRGCCEIKIVGLSLGQLFAIQEFIAIKDVGEAPWIPRIEEGSKRSPKSLIPPHF